MNELDDLLQHHGIKGMKWGHRVGGRIKEELGSLKRERQWNNVINKVNKMSTKEVNKVSNRIRLENDLKRLSKNKSISSSTDKKDYRLRGKMSDQELNRKVERLRAKESLTRNASEATKAQREFGLRVIKTAAPIAIKYALTKKISSEDVINALINPNGESAKAKASVVNAGLKKLREPTN